MDQSGSSPAGDEVRCGECGTVLRAGQDREVTDDGVFCRPCFNNLTAQLQEVVAAQGADVNYAAALLGAVLGGAAGSLVWWGFTVATNIAFGLVAVVIGVAVGKGTLLLSGNKRHLNLQALSALVSVVAFFYASFLVNRTFIQRSFAKTGETLIIPFLPEPDQFFRVVMAGFDVMDLVFLAIVVWEAWRIPAPLKLPVPSHA